ncbi:hypothetical protein H0H87_007709 [Tephrocybe sp. NHM501043]|nr:hypothetical protein H0H87_007709 [Tephrocybe sp. NHM501043]
MHRTHADADEADDATNSTEGEYTSTMTTSSSSHANPKITPTHRALSSTSARHFSYSSVSSPNAMSPRSTTLPVPLSPPAAAATATPSTFDLKRLLAKPAPPYARTYGSGSDSEGMSDSAVRNKGVMLVDRGFTLPRTKEKAQLGRSKSVQSFLRGRDEYDAPHEKEKEKEKRPRNVLRRRPSTQKSAPSKPAMSPTIATAEPAPLPLLSPRSPLTASILPGSLSPTLSRGSSPRPTTASSPAARSGSSLDKPLPVLPAQPAKGREGYGGAQPRRERSREWLVDREEPEEYADNVTDETGKHVDARKRLRELKGVCFLFPFFYDSLQLQLPFFQPTCTYFKLRPLPEPPVL